MTWRADLTNLVALRPAPGRWRVALQAAISIGIPAVGFALAGRADLGLLASTGSFTALHLAARSRHERAVWLPVVAAGLVAASAVGVAASHSYLLSVVTLVVVAITASVLCLGFSMGPPGAMFFVLAAGVAMRLAGPVAVGGDALNGGLIVGLVALGALISYAVVVVPLAVPSVRAHNVQLRLDLPRRRFAVDTITRTILVRIALAACVGAAIAAPLGVHRVYWVLVTVVVILQNGHQLRLNASRAVQRVLGTLLGVGVLAVALIADPRGLVLAVVLVALQFLVEMVIVRNYGLALVLITPLALLIATQGASTDVGAVVTERIVDTLLGGGVALAVLFAAYLVRRARSSPPVVG